MAVILCADDDEAMRDLYQIVLGQRYDLHLYADGRSLLDAFPMTDADLVVLDVDMPRMRGIEVCQELRKRPDGFDVPIVLVSAQEGEDEIVAGLSAGADDYLVKPLKPPELLAKLTMVLRKRQEAVTHDLGLSLGSRFAGRYDIVRKLGAGGCGSVYHATDTQTTPHRPVALKVYDAVVYRRNDEPAVSLFLREAYTQSKLDHPGIAKLHDFGQAAGMHYIVMEYVEGLSLADKIKREGTVSEGELLVIALCIAKALMYMAKEKIVHRDIKPGNILVHLNGDAKLADFGLARLQDDRTLSGANEFTGTPQFVSPEQISGDADVDIMCDVYSLGATLYYAATGVQPFDGDSTVAILKNHFELTPKPASALNHSVSEPFAELIGRMIRVQRTRRCRPDELVIGLQRLLDDIEHDH